MDASRWILATLAAALAVGALAAAFPPRDLGPAPAPAVAHATLPSLALVVACSAGALFALAMRGLRGLAWAMIAFLASTVAFIVAVLASAQGASGASLPLVAAFGFAWLPFAVGPALLAAARRAGDALAAAVPGILTLLLVAVEARVQPGGAAAKLGAAAQAVAALGLAAVLARAAWRAPAPELPPARAGLLTAAVAALAISWALQGALVGFVPLWWIAPALLTIAALVRLPVAWWAGALAALVLAAGFVVTFSCDGVGTGMDTGRVDGPRPVILAQVGGGGPVSQTYGIDAGLRTTCGAGATTLGLAWDGALLALALAAHQRFTRSSASRRSLASRRG